jgi:hypothetical protein
MARHAFGDATAAAADARARAGARVATATTGQLAVSVVIGAGRRQKVFC